MKTTPTENSDFLPQRNQKNHKCFKLCTVLKPTVLYNVFLVSEYIAFKDFCDF